MKESDLDLEKVGEEAREMQLLITKLITSRERSKEATCGAIMGLANVLVMMTTICVPESEKTVDLVAAAISRAFKSAEEYKKRKKGMEVIVYEISTDPEAPGG
jgi:hypothetical protein